MPARLEVRVHDAAYGNGWTAPRQSPEKGSSFTGGHVSSGPRWSPFGLPQTHDPNAAAMTSILNVPPPSAFGGGLAKGSAKGSAFVSVGANKSPSRSAPFFGGAGAKGSGAGALVMPEKIGSRSGGAGAKRSPPANGSAIRSG